MTSDSANEFTALPEAAENLDKLHELVIDGREDAKSDSVDGASIACCLKECDMLVDKTKPSVIASDIDVCSADARGTVAEVETISINQELTNLKYSIILIKF